MGRPRIGPGSLRVVNPGEGFTVKHSSKPGSEIKRYPREREWGHVRNWDEYQHYSGRNNTWLKLYPRILRDPSFVALPDAVRFHVIGCFMLALETDNLFALDPIYLAGVLNTTEPVDVGLLLDSGFIASGRASNKRLDKTRQEKTRLDSPSAFYAAADELGFPGWWDRYPRQVDKLKAAKSWLKLNEKDRLAAAGPGLDAWLEYWRAKNEPQFIPYPATWLNNRRWESKPPPIRQAPRGRGSRTGRDYDRQDGR